MASTDSTQKTSSPVGASTENAPEVTPTLTETVDSVIGDVGGDEMAPGGGMQGMDVSVAVSGGNTVGGGPVVAEAKESSQAVATGAGSLDTPAAASVLVQLKQAKPSEAETSSKDDEVVILGSTAKDKSAAGKRKTPARRQQPPRPGKLQKTEKKPVGKKVPEFEEPQTKEVMEEFEIKEEFFEVQKLQEAYELLKVQKWDHLFHGEEKVDLNEVKEFYKKVSKVKRGPFMYLEFEYKGEEMMISSKDIANLLNIDHEGYDVFVKGAWPSEVTDQMKEEMQLLVCNTSDPVNTTLTTTLMEPMKKVLHKLLVTNLMPRGSKPSLAQIQDILVLDKVIKKEKVNLPKLIVHQLEYISGMNNLGYASIVKKILLYLNSYEPSEEVLITRPLTDNTLHRLGLVLDETEGWIREPKKKVTPVVADEPVVGQGMEKVQERLTEIQKDISQLKDDMATVLTSVWVIEETMNDLQEAVKTMAETMTRGFDALSNI